MGIIIAIIIIVLVALWARSSPPSEAIGNWNHLFADVQHDPEEFYKSVEEIIKEKEVPDVKTGRKNFKQGGMLSSTRVYLVVHRKDLIFHICAAPWGTGFFFSWWMRVELSAWDEFLGRIPLIGPALVARRQLKTYYNLDTDAMYRSSVHQSVLAAIDLLTEAKGVRGLSELERKPEMHTSIK